MNMFDVADGKKPTPEELHERRIIRLEKMVQDIHTAICGDSDLGIPGIVKQLENVKRKVEQLERISERLEKLSKEQDELRKKVEDIEDGRRREWLYGALIGGVLIGSFDKVKDLASLIWK